MNAAETEGEFWNLFNARVNDIKCLITGGSGGSEMINDHLNRLKTLLSEIQQCRYFT